VLERMQVVDGHGWTFPFPIETGLSPWPLAFLFGESNHASGECPL
jgi:hypothetical protein